MRKKFTIPMVAVIFAMAVSLSIMSQWNIGFWSDTLPLSVYILCCITYVVFIGCIATGTYFFFRNSEQKQEGYSGKEVDNSWHIVYTGLYILDIYSPKYVKEKE